MMSSVAQQPTTTTTTTTPTSSSTTSRQQRVRRGSSSSLGLQQVFVGSVGGHHPGSGHNRRRYSATPAGGGGGGSASVISIDAIESVCSSSFGADDDHFQISATSLDLSNNNNPNHHLLSNNNNNTGSSKRHLLGHIGRNLAFLPSPSPSPPPQVVSSSTDTVCDNKNHTTANFLGIAKPTNNKHIRGSSIGGGGSFPGIKRATRAGSRLRRSSSMGGAKDSHNATFDVITSPTSPDVTYNREPDHSIPKKLAEQVAMNIEEHVRMKNHELMSSPNRFLLPKPLLPSSVVHGRCCGGGKSPSSSSPVETLDTEIESITFHSIDENCSLFDQDGTFHEIDDDDDDDGFSFGDDNNKHISNNNNNNNDNDNDVVRRSSNNNNCDHHHVGVVATTTTEQQQQQYLHIAPLNKREIVLGAKIANGCFSDIYEITKFDPSIDVEDTILYDEQIHARLSLFGISGCSSSVHSRGCNVPEEEEVQDEQPVVVMSSQQQQRYVVKHVRPEILHDTDTFESAVLDLGVEGKILASLDHPNIIKLRGWPSYGLEGLRHTGLYDSYFLVLDHLIGGTLLDKIHVHWKKDKQSFSSRRAQVGNILTHNQNKTNIMLKRHQLLLERLKVATDIASALSYLHNDKNLIYRDLKPNNIGFDLYGNVKLFDFGLARHLPKTSSNNSNNNSNDTADYNNKHVSNDQDCNNNNNNNDALIENDTYEMTGGTGSLRYMSPEVALSMPYNAKADVYSLCILLHEIICLRKPFIGYNPEMMISKVFEGGGRPSTTKSTEFTSRLWPKTIVQMMTNGWSSNIAQRPTMNKVHSTLRKQYDKLILLDQRERTCNNNNNNKNDDAGYGCGGGGSMLQSTSHHSACTTYTNDNDDDDDDDEEEDFDFSRSENNQEPTTPNDSVENTNDTVDEDKISYRC